MSMASYSTAQGRGPALEQVLGNQCTCSAPVYATYFSAFSVLSPRKGFLAQLPCEQSK